MYDIVFISYREANAEKNWKALDDRFQGRTRRLHGIKGIHKAHWLAANSVTTEMFYVVDGDASISPDFHFNYDVPVHQRDHVHVFRARNPVNDLVYGYGAVKLLPTSLVLGMDLSDIKPDMTTSLRSDRYKIINQISNLTMFNTDPFNAWRSAFRECAKLSSGIIDNQVSMETKSRLDAWCTVGHERLHGGWTIKGAKAGRAYGKANSMDRTAMMMINDFDWMMSRFGGERP